MATENAPQGAAAGKSQASQPRQATAKKNEVPENETVEERAARTDEPQFFDTTIAKVVERENAEGDKEWVEVMSDNLYPGEKLKRTHDEELAEEKAKTREAADKDKK